MSVVLKPAKDAAFYASLAEVGESLLVTAAMTASIRKDFSSLNSLVDFLMGSGYKVSALMQNMSITATLPQSEKDLAPAGETRKDCTLTMAFATAFSVQDVEGNPSRQPSPPEAIALAHRVGVLYNSPQAANHSLLKHLDQLLQDSASRVFDSRVLGTLLDAGADPNQKKVSAQGTSAKTTPMVEALLVGNFQAAALMASAMSTDSVKAFIGGLLRIKGKNGTTSAHEFGVNHCIRKLVESLHMDPSGVGEYLKQVDLKLLSTGKSGLEDSARFRMQIAAAHLEEDSKTYLVNWEPQEMSALIGNPGDSVHASIKRLLDAFADKTMPWPTASNPDPDKWKCYTDKNNPCKFEEVEADFIYQAVRTHCIPGLTISKEVMVAAAKEGGPGIQHAVNGHTLNIDDQDFSPVRFRETLKILQEAGGNLNALPEGNNALHALAMSDSESMMKMLPILLDMGVDPNACDLDGNVPTGKIRKDQESKIKQWDSICKSHAARNTAMNMILEMELEEKKSTP